MIKVMGVPDKITDYINGNANVQLYSDGTKIITTEDDELRFDFPNNTDVTITHKCDKCCKYCYLGCSPEGKHADILAPGFLDYLHPGVELAINLNDMSHPQLSKFLIKMRDKGVIVNGTINQYHFMKYHKVLKGLCNSRCLWGLGISLDKPTPEFIDLVKQFDNAVIHVINGILTADDLDMLRDNNLKMLILGYKNIRRGADYCEDNSITIKMRQRYLYDVLPTLANHFAVVSFDNLAISQLNVKRIVSDEEWDKYYMGDEGSQTFAIDMVDGVFSLNSMVTDPQRLYPIMNTVEDMFAVIQSERKENKKY